MGTLTDRELFESETNEVLKKYPKLFATQVSGKTILKGDIDLIDEYSVQRDTYSVEIHPTNKYPYRFPHVFETGQKLPWNADWHVFENDGHLCIKVEPEEILICKTGIKLLSFIELQLIPYLFNQTFRRYNGYYINERPHGLLGVVNFYQDHFKEKNIYRLIRLMEFVLNNKEPKRTSKCFCISGKKYRKCHKNSYRMLHEIGTENVSFHINLIQETLNRRG